MRAFIILRRTIVLFVGTICFANFSFASNPTEPVDMTVFGIHLGKPLGLNECPRGDVPIYGTQKYHYVLSVDQNEVCYQVTDGGSKLLSFPLKKGMFPLLVKPGSMPLLTIIEGNVEGVDVETNGIELDEETFNVLVKKYGKPTRLITSEVKNLSGAQFPARDAYWKLDGLSVTYKTVTYDLLHGHLSVTTDKATEHTTREQIETDTKRINF